MSGVSFFMPRSARTAYDPTGWYWDVANRSAPLSSYGSRGAAYIDPSVDGGYASFVNAGSVPSKIATDGELAVVLAEAGQEGRVVLNTQPTDWGGCGILQIILAVQAAGVVLTSTGTPSLSGHYQLLGEPLQTMDRTQIYINAHSQLPNLQPLPWGAYSGTITFANETEFANVYKGLNDYFQAWKTFVYHGGTAPQWGTWTIP